MSTDCCVIGAHPWCVGVIALHKIVFLEDIHVQIDFHSTNNVTAFFMFVLHNDSILKTLAVHSVSQVYLTNNALYCLQSVLTNSVPMYMLKLEHLRTYVT